MPRQVGLGRTGDDVADDGSNGRTNRRFGGDRPREASLETCRLESADSAEPVHALRCIESELLSVARLSNATIAELLSAHRYFSHEVELLRESIATLAMGQATPEPNESAINQGRRMIRQQQILQAIEDELEKPWRSANATTSELLQLLRHINAEVNRLLEHIEDAARTDVLCVGERGADGDHAKAK